MIAARVLALALGLASEGPVAVDHEPSPPRFGVSLGAGVGLGMRRPLLPEGLASTRVRPSAAVRVSATPWLERPAGHGFAVRMPFSYASTIRAAASEQGPGLDGTRRLRGQRLELAVDVLAALGRGRRAWLGGGVAGGYTAIELASPRGLPVGHGLGLVAARVPAMLVLARGAVALGTAPALGLALGDPRVHAMGLPRAGLGLAVSSWLRVRLGRRLDLAIHHEEQHARFWGPLGAQSDGWRTLTAGLVLTASPRRPPTSPRTARDPGAPLDTAPAPGSAAARADHDPPSPAAAELPLAPALAGTTLDGEPIDLASLRGRVVVIDFWASWCAPCRESMPQLQALHDELGPAGLVVIGVSVDETEADARAFVTQAGIELPIVLDRDQRLAGTWKPSTMPTTYVIDRNGTIATIHAGYTTTDSATLRAEVVHLLTEDPRP